LRAESVASLAKCGSGPAAIASDAAQASELRPLGTDDAAACPRDAGLGIAETPTSKRDLAKIQDQFNIWAKETGLPYRHLSLICAMSVGETHQGDRYGSERNNPA
jgi:hypothetical protein